MSLPPVPPRPYSATPTPHLNFESPPHFQNPLAAPRPHHVDPSLDANSAMAWLMRDCPLLLWGWCWDWDDTDSTLQMARDLDNSSASGADWSPWAPAAAAAAAAARTPSLMPPRLPSPPRDGSLTVPLPSTAALTAALPTVTAPSHDPQLQLAWARDVLFLVDAPRPLHPTPPRPPRPLARHGAYPNLLPANPRAAFRDFETSARAGYAPAWFRLARDYEVFNDSAHALDCLTRGARANDPAALHRLGAVLPPRRRAPALPRFLSTPAQDHLKLRNTNTDINTMTPAFRCLSIAVYSISGSALKLRNLNTNSERQPFLRCLPSSSVPLCQDRRASPFKYKILVATSGKNSSSTQEPRFSVFLRSVGATPPDLSPAAEYFMPTYCACFSVGRGGLCPGVD
ncbi:hypothetical protein DFH09DRAFT_1358880 [Mycena vulgaris]|nr:hypothetical protein DFH09DRAFT_1358880 [Mycena vulgaris]